LLGACRRQERRLRLPAPHHPLDEGRGQSSLHLPHGVLFRGDAEATIRQQLVRSGYLKGIIGLPANLFYGTGIPPVSWCSTRRTPLAARASS